MNHDGSSGMVEVEASKAMWGRSMARNLRYIPIINDGDNKNCSETLELDPYPGFEVVKECNNHVANRPGTGLRNLVTTEFERGNTLRCRKTGLLQESVASKCSTTAELRKKTMWTLKHFCSTDDKPQHEDCPAGKDSWCFFQRALTYGKTPPIHQGKSSCYLVPRVAEAVAPHYERLNSVTASACWLTGHTVKISQKKYAKQVKKAEGRQLKTWKRRRLEISLATARAQQEYERREEGSS
ncbi:hypothetical protein RRG08_049965 [Elysia crispata]|uniref:Mutator-like transposase domain-containing protein n=1 Tax=Elysia crispata TaxID=231223 RepID=A0AAE1E9R6_9GAST|nr:hypothetical protein RRG08_049965 [Elysia crispata]